MCTSLIMKQFCASKAFGYTFEDLRLILTPMGRDVLSRSALWGRHRWPSYQTSRNSIQLFQTFR
jgi:hypothetical protein